MSEMEQIYTDVVVKRVGQPLFEEGATSIKLEDDAGGGFIIVSQPGRESHLKIANAIVFDLDEWPAIRKAIDGMVAAGHKYNKYLED